MQKKIGRVLLSIILTVMLIAVGVVPLTADDASTDPCIPHDNGGQKYRIGYCETEPWANYASNLYALVNGLEKFGWVCGIEDLPYREGQYDTSEMWHWLSQHEISPYLEFVDDAHYTLSEMEENAADTIIDRLNHEEDIDLVITMGTGAGKAIGNEKHSVPVMVFSTSNAVQSGIIKTLEDSGSDHIWARMDPDRYKRQFSVFHDIFEFKKMGLVYENSELGRIYAALDDAMAVAEQEGFELIIYPINEPADESDQERYYKDLITIHEQLAEEVDAMYLTMAPIETSRLSEVLEPFTQNKIPVFSQMGSQEVQSGALMSIAQADFDLEGQFAAEAIIMMLNGTSARDLTQLLQSTPHIILNLEAARKIGYEPPFEILLVADEVFTSISAGEEQ